MEPRFKPVILAMFLVMLICSMVNVTAGFLQKAMRPQALPQASIIRATVVYTPTIQPKERKEIESMPTSQVPTESPKIQSTLRFRNLLNIIPVKVSRGIFNHDIRVTDDYHSEVEEYMDELIFEAPDELKSEVTTLKTDLMMGVVLQDDDQMNIAIETIERIRSKVQ